MNADAIVQTFGGLLAARCVRGDDERLVARATEMLDHPKHRVGNTVDVREETLCDDRNAHNRIVTASTVEEVAYRNTTRKESPPAYWRGHINEEAPMRVVRTALVVAFSLVLVVTGCSRQITGTAQVDPNQTLASITKDGFGIRAGSEDAPVQVELYTEPQCSHCADLQHDFGDQIAYYIGIGALAVTYRPVTFLDQVPDGYSSHVAKAMFAAAAPGGAEGTDGTTARAFQHFV